MWQRGEEHGVTYMEEPSGCFAYVVLVFGREFRDSP